MSKYTVKAIFPTIQGEGCAMGMPALFVRMAGCNMWSGIEDKREADAVRNRADCPRWCFAPDTPILTPSHRWAALGSLRPGDRVLAADPATLRLVEATVLRAESRRAERATIHTTTGDLVGTRDHKFWQRRIGWTPAVDMVDGRGVAISSPPPFYEVAGWRRGWLAGVAFGDGCFWTLRKSATVREVAYDRDSSWISKTGEYRRFRLAMLDAEALDAFETWADEAGFDLHRAPHHCSGYGAHETTDALWLTQSERADAFERWLDAGDSAAFYAGFLAGTVDAEGHVRPREVRISQSAEANPVNYARISRALAAVGISATADADGFSVYGTSRWRLLSHSPPVLQRKATAMNGDTLKDSHGSVLAVEPRDVGEVVTLSTTAGCYFAGGMLVKNCDTDFRGGTGHTAEELVAEITAQLVQPLIVITGGEPLLQVDQELVDALLKVTRPAGVRVAFETNGTVAAQFDQDHRGLWITMSPKRSRAETVLTHCDELKLVYPPYDPDQWEDFPARHRWVQPVDSRDIGIREVNQRCVDFVLAHRDWRLGSQAHKAWGIA